MRTSFKGMSTVEIATYISQQLLEHGIPTTLSGGFCAEIYTSGEYTSADIDLIDQSILKERQIKNIMENMGFKKVGKHYKHQDTKYTVEFPASPLAVGKTLVKDVCEIETEYGVLRLLNATDCVRDRLMGYYAYDDERCLEQAILVALNQPESINFALVESWSKEEGDEKKYNRFFQEFSKRKIGEFGNSVILQ